MASLNHIADSYVNSVDKPFDYALKQRIKFTIKYWRAMLLRREFERKGTDKTLIQGFLMALEAVDSLDSCLVTSGCTWKRTTLKVPKPIAHGGSSSSFLYVGPAKYSNPGALPYTEETAAGIGFQCFNSFTGNYAMTGEYRYINDYIYIPDKPLTKFVYVEGVFDNPEDAHEVCVGAANCVSDDDEFPIGLHMLNTILEGIRKNELRILTNDHEVNTQPNI
ncbi:MAG: hypothetical protein COA82_03715 [Alkaliphilus sp.]|nr:MAG: hypothetical protein COA82_03715 [Alkaliphilus sp.]